MRIKSKLKATAMAVALAALPLFAQSAGLGRLNVLSGLGQPLRAEIDLVAVQNSEVDSLRAALASPDSHRDAQIDFPAASLGLRFNLEKRSNGQHFISIISAQSVNEPFLDFLVELKWEGGKVLREYTALLDPIGYNAAGVAPVAAAPAAPQPSPSQVAPGKPVAAPKPAVVLAPPPKAPEAKPAEPPAQPKPQPKPEPEQAGGEQAYTVKGGDTLVGVANMNMPEGVSLDQMLVGLYRENADAFDGNMNRLKKGKVLTIPARETVAAIDVAEARREVRMQAEDWRAYRAKLADAAPVSAATETGASGKIATKVEDKGASKETSAKDTLKLSKGDETKLKERVQSLEGEATARQKALAEANTRVAELEKTNKKLEDLLALKNKQGAELQKQADAAKAQAAKPQAKVDPKPAEIKPEPKPAPVEVKKPVEEKPAEPVKAEEAKPAEIVKAPELPKQPAAEPEAAKPKPKKKPLPPPEPEPEPTLLENPLVLGGGLIALMMAAGGAIWALRRRKKGNFEDSVITGSDLKSNTMVGNTGGAVISTGVTENSFLTDFSRAGLGTIDTDEVDPIAEAEVYMAYGRDTQAEEILKDALTRDGSRQEVRLKLLEIYNARKNAGAFESVAQELYTATQGQGALWAQAAEMGRVLDPQNSLYQQQAPVDTGDLDKTMILSAGTLGELSETTRLNSPIAAEVPMPATDLDFQLDVPATADEAASEAGNSLDFDLGFGSEPAAEAAPAVMDDNQIADLDLDVPGLTAEAESPAPVAESMDFDIGGFDLDAPAEAAPAAVAAEPAADDGILSLDIPLDMPAEAAPAAEVALDMPDMGLPDLSAPAAEAPMAELDAPDLATGLDFNFDVDADLAAQPASMATPDLPLDDISLDLDIAPEAASTGDVIDFGAELDDPVTTKIDLARAYIDMGDTEGAREILQEASSEGNAEQKATAEALLAQL
ncbi:FimV/HubP family polar landmark protein [Chitinimonas sp. BJYL2]|uniref:FimV/HubP family polar landmark protein n=1 Tax=Chitinimonas sp. BJYL2 TaxID=2976696 RepID=UPI0022B38A58|nr:FimV/HubP family polar landmark protein [Chitinimonas sp. BJYL2]